MPTDYEQLERQLRALLEGEPDVLANCANFAAFLASEIPELNFAGLYLAKGEDLVLGPFIGKPSCTRIRVGRGVCGKAFAADTTILVDDVDAFDDHIVCDSASASEVVVPLRDSAGALGVVDCDSPRRARFTENDRRGIERLARALTECIDVRALAREA
ncbi:MAG: GAF domain-containing protein [Candidatus Eremiobacteraeota bacterium]|uniref:GAF domain-containing protein n=1 Tax=mine drainage metagenome TaxID=410659 RepID=E6PJ78_9ZZZZ|nr:GAF domain-containing protein [Candidatus Eremiobacteraeota bacterium]